MINKRQFEIQKCRELFALFAKAVTPTLEYTDFHLKYYRILHRFVLGEIKKLIITVPPQHGKSQGSTRLLPAFKLGMNPNCKIAVASYSDRFAQKFNRDIQRIIDTSIYREIFPETSLREKRSDNYTRNANEFEIVGKEGFLKAIGRGGALTGNPVDVMIMDDLYKDRMEGNSPIIREAVWEWYTSVVKTRLHNDSQELIVFTRWHEDDLIGRIEAKEEVRTLTSFDDIDESYKGWYKLNFEAIKDSPPTELDNRKMGDVLWSNRHNFELLTEKRKLDPHTFECMYQGNPSSSEGLLYSSFKTYDKLPDSIKKYGNYTDTADQGEDYLCSVCYAVDLHNNIYITDVIYTQESMEVTEGLVSKMLLETNTRKAYIESNNGGRGFARNVQKLAPKVSIEWFHQSSNKESRILSNSATVTQIIYMPSDWKNRWSQFYHHITTYKRIFRANINDDAPDVLTGIVEKESNSSNFRVSFI